MGRIKDKRCWKRGWGSLEGIWSGRLGEALAFVDRIGALATAEGIVSTARLCGAMGAPAPNIGALFAEGFFLMPPDFAADPTSRLWSMPDDDLSSFNREDDPPTNGPLRILVDDDVKEYALPWPYEFRDGDFSPFNPAWLSTKAWRCAAGLYGGSELIKPEKTCAISAGALRGHPPQKGVCRRP